MYAFHFQITIFFKYFTGDSYYFLNELTLFFSRPFFNMIKVPTLVSPAWISEQILSKVKNLCILDVSWHLPIFKRDQQEEYLQEHIPGAQFFDIEKCARPSEDTQKLSHTLPTADFFAEYVGNLGIDNESHVVVYENNAKFGAFSAPRAWWMFCIFGHAKISIMEGGLPLWIKEGRETTDKIPLTERSVFQASFNADLFKTFGDVERNLEERKFQVMDARPEGRFQGIQPEPRQGIFPTRTLWATGQHFSPLSKISVSDHPFFILF